MNREIYLKLVEVAKVETLITYGEIAPLAGLDMASPADRTVMSHLLDGINKYEALHKRPMLSAVVVRAGENTPGDGFFACARDFGRLATSDSIEELAFWASKVKSVHRHWTHQA